MLEREVQKTDRQRARRVLRPLHHAEMRLRRAHAAPEERRLVAHSDGTDTRSIALHLPFGLHSSSGVKP
jgi:hypothetical protein